MSSVALGGFQSHRFLCCHLKLSVIKAFQDILCVSFSCSFLQTWKAPEVKPEMGELHNPLQVLFPVAAGNVLLSIPGKGGWGCGAEGCDTPLQGASNSRKTLKEGGECSHNSHRMDQKLKALGSSRSFGYRCEIIPTFPILGLLKSPRRQQDFATCTSLS